MDSPVHIVRETTGEGPKKCKADYCSSFFSFATDLKFARPVLKGALEEYERQHIQDPWNW